MPVAHHGKHQQQKRDQQQARGLRRVNRVAALRVVVLRRGIGHVDIVALPGTESAAATSSPPINADEPRLKKSLTKRIREIRVHPWK